jgi:hypothetical protein
MTSFASIDEAWGPPQYGYNITQRPSGGPAPANGPVKESFSGAERDYEEPRRSSSYSDKRREVRDYLRRVYAMEGAEGLCRLLDRRACREIRNSCLLDVGRDEVIILFLIAIIAYLSFKLALVKS